MRCDETYHTAYDARSVGSNRHVIVEVLYALETSRSSGQVAQLVEHVTENHGVAGSIPALATKPDHPIKSRSFRWFTGPRTEPLIWAQVTPRSQETCGEGRGVFAS